MRLFPTVALIILAFACSSKQNAAKEKNKVVKENNAGTQQQDQSVVIPDDSLFLSFERSQCFGECPAYRITINNKGQCLYEGFKWVERSGRHHAEISEDVMLAIRQKAENIGFFDMKDKYDGPVSDLPSTIIIMSTDAERKQVIDRFEGPKELRDFEKYLDLVLLKLDWEAE